MAFFHVWFSTKNRKWLLQGDVAEAVKQYLSETARVKGLRLLECEAVVDHVHLLLELDDKASLPRAMNDLKGVTSRRVFELFSELKLDAHTEHLWQAGYASKIVPPAALNAVAKYIRTQWDRLDDYDRSSMPRP